MTPRRATLALLAALTLAACDAAARGDAADEPLQGVVEHESRRLGFELPGRVSSVLVHVGDVVAPGDALAALDPALPEAEVVARRADVALAEAQLALLRAGARSEERRATAAELSAAREQLRVVERQRARALALAERGAAPVADAEQLDATWAAADARVRTLTQAAQVQRRGARDEELAAAEARLSAASAGLHAAELRVAQATLRAPAAGVVLDRLIEPGEVVAPGTPVVEVAELDRPYVDVFVPQARAGEAHLGRVARVQIDASALPLRGVVERVAERTEFTPRYLFSERERPSLVVRVRVRVSDPEHRLRAGVPAFVRWDAVADESPGARAEPVP